MSLNVVKNATCTFCGCVCDDMELHVEGDSIIKAKNACSLGESWFRNHTAEHAYPDALIDGKEASLDDAVEVAADFLYDAERDVYVCPAGEDLTYRYTTEERGIPIRRYWINGCKTCPLRSNCTTGNERRISRWEREDLVDDMDSRLGRDPDYMTVRRCTVEHPFGTIKAWMGGTHFLMRRLKNVRSEMALNVLAYNIKRMLALLGVRGLMCAMRG